VRAQPHRIAAQAQRVLASGAHADVAGHVPEKLAGVEVAAEAIEAGAVLTQRRDARIDRGGDVHEVRRVAGSRHVRVPDRSARRSSLGEHSFAGCVAASVEHGEPDRTVIGVIDRTLLAPR
jgi:hypothetical protein